MNKRDKYYWNAFNHVTDLGNKPPLMDPSGDLEMCKVQGEVFYQQAMSRESNPYPKGSANHEWFDAGWVSGQEELCGDGNGDLS